MAGVTPRLVFMFIKVNRKADAIRAFINTWLKDPSFYCNNCGMPFDPKVYQNDKGVWYEHHCCDNPQIGRNIDHTKAVVNQNKVEREKTKNDYAKMDDKGAARLGLSMPPKLYQDLETYFKTYGEKLFNNKDDLHAFMREFPAFSIPRRV